MKWLIGLFSVGLALYLLSPSSKAQAAKPPPTYTYNITNWYIQSYSVTNWYMITNFVTVSTGYSVTNVTSVKTTNTYNLTNYYAAPISNMSVLTLYVSQVVTN